MMYRGWLTCLFLLIASFSPLSAQVIGDNLTPDETQLIDDAKQGLSEPSGNIHYFWIGETSQPGLSGWYFDPLDLQTILGPWVGINFDLIDRLARGDDQLKVLFVALILEHEYTHIRSGFDPEEGDPDYPTWHADLQIEDAATLCVAVEIMQYNGDHEKGRKICIFIKMLASSYGETLDAFPNQSFPPWQECFACRAYNIDTMLPK